MKTASVVNAIYQRMFQNLFVYNILFEDSDVDQDLLKLDPKSKVVAITGAGCGVANMASHPC